MKAETDALTRSQTGCWADKKCDVWLWRDSYIEYQQRNIYWCYIAFVDAIPWPKYSNLKIQG